MTSVSKISLYEPDEACRIASRLLGRKGFAYSHRGIKSIYMVRMKNGKVDCKVRISDHSTLVGDDIAHQIIFDYRTILPDIETKVERILKNVGCQNR
jgi:hypothetical protein